LASWFWKTDGRLGKWGRRRLGEGRDGVVGGTGHKVSSVGLGRWGRRDRLKMGGCEGEGVKVEVLRTE